MNGPMTHHNLLSGNLVDPIVFTSSTTFTTAAVDDSLVLKTFNAASVTTLNDYIAPYDLVLMAIDFRCPAWAGTGAGVFSGNLVAGTASGITMEGCALGTLPSLMSSSATVATWNSLLTRVGTSSYYRLLVTDIKALGGLYRTHKTIFLPAGYAFSNSTVDVNYTMTGTTPTGTKSISLRFIFKNVHGQGMKATDFAV